MKELLDTSLTMPLLLPTFMLGLVILYWLSVIIGAIDLDFLDFNVDTDVEVDMEVDIDADSGIDSGNEISMSWMNSLLVFFNIGKVPFMVFLTMLSLPFWLLSIAVNHYIGFGSLFIGLLFVIPVFIVSLFIAKILTYPLAKLFSHMEKEDEESKSAIGKICLASSEVTDQKIGQAQVQTTGSPILLNIITRSGTSLKKGDSALVIEFKKDRNIYLVEPYSTI